MLHVCLVFTVSFHSLRFFLQFQKFYSSYEIEMVTLFFSLRFPQFLYITVVLYMTYIKGRGVIEVNVVSGICIEALSDAVTCQ